MEVSIIFLERWSIRWCLISIYILVGRKWCIFHSIFLDACSSWYIVDDGAVHGAQNDQRLPISLLVYDFVVPSYCQRLTSLPTALARIVKLLVLWSEVGNYPLKIIFRPIFVLAASLLRYTRLHAISYIILSQVCVVTVGKMPAHLLQIIVHFSYMLINLLFSRNRHL